MFRIRHRVTERLVGRVLADQGLTEDYLGDNFIQATSRELASAMNVSPVAMHTAANTIDRQGEAESSLIVMPTRRHYSDLLQEDGY